MVMIIPPNNDEDSHGVDIDDGDEYLCIPPNYTNNDNDNHGVDIGDGNDYPSYLHQQWWRFGFFLSW